MWLPNTLMLPLAKTTSDHVPCMIQIGTSIPKAKVFKFENYWVDQIGFLDMVKSVWSKDFRTNNSASKVAQGAQKDSEKMGQGHIKIERTN
jgi:hypothetical protein